MRRDKDTTREKFLEAIERIKSGTVSNKELKARKIVKLNRATVEKEAGFVPGLLCHYPDVVKIIEEIASQRA